MHTETLIEALIAAFWDDPLYAWLYARADRAAALRDNFRVVLASARERAHVDHTPDGRAVAVWTDPGVRLMDDPMPILDVLARRAPHRVAAAVAGMDDCSAHQPEHAHVLHLVGVHPDLAGRGVGTRLLEPRLSAIDDLGGVTYLESSSRRNHSLYHRLGFRQLAEVRIGDGPSMWPMARRGSAMYQPSTISPMDSSLLPHSFF